MTNAADRIKTQARQKHPIVIDGHLTWTSVEKNSFLFLFGGVGYGLIEVIWRGRTHPSMVITGGICFLLIYGINKALRRHSVLLRSVACCAAITAVEFSVGTVVNLMLHLSVWDYSANRFNVLGQICALYTFFWFLLSIPLTFVAARLAKKIDKL